MRSDEVRALGELFGDAGAGIADQARDVHAAVAGRIFDALGPTVRPVRVAHDAISGSAYAASRGLTGAIIGAAGLAVAQTRRGDERSILDDSRGRAAIAALNGARGDRLHRSGSVLAVPLAIYDDAGDPVTAAVDERVAIFVHGLGETDRSWRRHGAGAYGPVLTALGFTPLYVRFNTGRALTETAAELVRALDALWASPARAPDQVVLIGHSMGGLVIREACAACTGESPWRERLRATISLGSPHVGAPLARAAGHAERALSRLPETRPFAGPLRDRSAALRDLARGSDAPFAPGVDHYFVSATITSRHDAVAGRMLGDLLVHRRSAWAQTSRTETLPFDAGHYRHLDAATHFDLLGHPAVAAQLTRWLTRPALTAR